MLATYGLRVGELTHLLVEDVDFAGGSIAIRSKPELFWSVKTGRRRDVPLVPGIRDLLERLIGDRKAGFVFLNEEYAAGQAQPALVVRVARGVPGPAPEGRRRPGRRQAGRRPSGTSVGRSKAFCRTMGQIPEKRVRGEFMKLTGTIGCPEFTRAHDLRHLFSSRAQEAGMNPLMVQELLGHATLDMTRRYTHLGLDAEA